MKKLQTFKPLATLALTTSLALTGCSETQQNREANIVEQQEYCTDHMHVHLYVKTPDGIVAYKECEGYHVILTQRDDAQFVEYSVLTASGEFVPELGTASKYYTELSNSISLNDDNSYYYFYTDDQSLDLVEENLIENNDIKVYTLK